MKTRRALPLMAFALIASALASGPDPVPVVVDPDEEEERRRRALAHGRSHEREPVYVEPRPSARMTLGAWTHPDPAPVRRSHGQPFGPKGKFCRKCGGLMHEEGRDGCTCR